MSPTDIRSYFKHNLLLVFFYCFFDLFCFHSSYMASNQFTGQRISSYRQDFNTGRKLVENLCLIKMNQHDCKFIFAGICHKWILDVTIYPCNSTRTPRSAAYNRGNKYLPWSMDCRHLIHTGKKGTIHKECQTILLRCTTLWQYSNVQWDDVFWQLP